MPSLLENDISQHGKSNLDDEKFVELLVDEISRARITIETEHARLHQGLGFDFSDRLLAVPAGTTTYILIKPNGVITHLRRFHVHSSSSPIQVQLFESPAGTDDGNIQTKGINRKRFSGFGGQLGDPFVTPLNIYYNPTVTDDGTRLRIDAVEGKKQDAGDAEGIGVEWIFEPSKVYLIKLENETVGSINYLIDMFWYHVRISDIT